MKKKLLPVLALALCLAVCAVLLVTCQGPANGKTVTLDQTALTLALDGDPVTLTATLSEGEGSVTWESSDPAVAAVDENGTVTPVSRGTATVTAKWGGAKATCQVTVGEPQHAPVFQADQLGLGITVALDQGETYQIISTVTYDGQPVEAQVRFASGDEAVATVSDSGLVTGVSKGSTQITVTAQYLGIDIEMTVAVAVQSDVSFTATTPQAVALTKRVTGKCVSLINPAKQIEKKTLSVKLVQADTDVSATADIQWSMAQGGEEVAELSDTQGQTVTVTSVAPGETTVLATVTVGGTKYTVAFGITVEEGPYEMVHTDNGKKAKTEACDGICDICGEKIDITHADEEGDCTCDWCGATIHTDANKDGICDNNKEHDLRIKLNEENAGTPALFAKIVAKNSGRYIILTEDLDWSGEGSANLFGDTYGEYTDVDAIKKFSGVLDGQGHMITGFRLGHSGENNDSVMFIKNTGTIKNIGFMFTQVTANGAQTGLVYENTGTISNVFAEATVNARSWAHGILAGINTGNIRNCITLVNEASTAEGNHLAGILGSYRGGRITSCYSVGNGHTTTNKAFTEAFNGLPTPGYKHYSNNNGLLNAIKAFGTGWSKSWAVTEEGITFGGKLVVIPVCEHTDDGKAEGSVPCDGKCDKCGEAVSLPHADGNGDCVCDYCQAETHTDEDFNGICDFNESHDLRIRLSEENAGTPALFAAIVAQNADRYMILTQDLDWSGEGTEDLFGNTYSQYTAVKAIEDFRGVLDGQGHRITGFRLGHSGAENDSAIILKNRGTVKNIGFIFTLATANSGQTGIIKENLGTVSNVFVDATVNARSWATGLVAGITKGKVENCITLVNEASTGTGNNLAGIVGAYRDGTIEHCYSVGNGFTTTEEAYTECFPNMKAPGYTHYQNNNALLAAVKSLSAKNGWASHWAVTEEGITFGGKLVLKYICEHTDDGKAQGTAPCDGICDKCGEEVSLPHADENGDCKCDYCGETLHVDANHDGICDNNPAHDFRIKLNMENAGTPALFAQIVSGNADSYLILTEDLVWAGLSTEGHAIGSFNGTLDGQGHSISGFTLGLGTIAAGDYHTCLFGTNNGTVKNIAFEYNVLKAAGNSMGLIVNNNGTVENVFASALFEANSWNTSAIVVYNNAKGVVKNCIGSVTTSLADQPSKDRLGAIVGADYNGTVENCYGLNPANSLTTPYVDTWGGGKYTDNTNYPDNNTMLAAVTELSAAKGWSDVWSVTQEGILFGEFLAVPAVCDHTDDGKAQGSTPCDGKCDKCGEEVFLPHADENADCLCDYCGKDLHKDLDNDGICDNNPAHDFRIQLNKENAGTPALFAATLQAAPNGHYILTEDLDWSGQTFAGVPTFSGILNGQGHSITGLTLGVVGDGVGNYHTALIGTLSGTLKNLLVDYTVEKAGGNTMGLVAVNSGKVENLAVKAHFDAYAWTTGAVAATNSGTGTVTNCIVTLSSTLADQAAKNRLGAIAGVDYNGKLMNCYAVNTENALTTPYVDTWGNGTYTGSANYGSDSALLAEVTKLFPANGWESYWNISDQGIAFGGKLLIKAVCDHTDDGALEGSTPCDGKCDKCGEAMEVTHPDENADCKCDWCEKDLHKDLDNDGVCDNNPAHDFRTKLNQENAGTPALFAATLKADLDGHFVLTEDLDWSGQKFVGLDTFSGILDGQGHSITGLTLGLVGDGAGGYHTALMGTLDGTLKNLLVDYTVSAAAGNSVGLVAVNSGKVENLAVKAHFDAYAWTTGAVAATNSGTGTVTNCIVTLSSTLADQPAKNRLGAIAGVDYNGKLMNCYAVNTENALTTPYVDTWGNGNYTGSANYADNNALLAAVTALSSSDGWASLWSVTESGIAFNGKTVIAGAAACEHEDKAPFDGKCDLCGEAVAAPEGTYFVSKDNAATPADFAALLNADLDGTYYLTEDLNWSGQKFTGLDTFSGILNGQGHSITGLTLGVVGDGTGNYHTALIGTLNGTLKNLRVDYTVSAAGGNSMGLVAVNKGTVSNLFVKAHFGAYAWTTGAVVATNNGTGTVENTVVTLSSTLADQPAKNRLDAIAGVDYNGKLMHCYAVNTENALTTPYVDTWGNGNYTGSANYADNNALLAAVTALNSSDGWASLWSVTESGIAFNGKTVIAEKPACEHEDKAPFDGKCDLCGEAVAAPEGTYFVSAETAATVDDFVALLNADLDGKFYVTENLDYASSGNLTTGIGAFSGTLDGQGHTVKGIKIKYNANDGYASNLFASNAGTVKDIAFTYSIVDGNGNKNALIGLNTGTVSNVYAKATVSLVKQYQYNGALVGQNTTGTVTNCIVDVTLTDAVTNIYDSFGAVASLNQGKVEKCYYKASSNGLTVPGLAYPWGSANDVKALDSTVTLPASEGWSGYWSVSGGTVKFG